MGSLARALLVIIMIALFHVATPAGTTGSINGTIVDAKTNAPIAGATVAVSSATQRASTRSDAHGHFAFVSLGPDTYTLSVSATAHEDSVNTGILILADQIQRYDLTLAPLIRVIGTTHTRSGGLVNPGQTSDVYTVDATLAQNAQGLGGGGGLYQTYSSLASVPGVYVPQFSLNQGQNNGAPFIRGGNFTQVGYEFDGVPVQREYDGYVGTSQGTTGQQSLQVYTGGGSASAAGEALAGYVNQVVKSGTNPPSVGLEYALGAQGPYNYAKAEAQGATPDGRFSYYVGSSGFNQYYRYADPFNGGYGPNPTAEALVPWSASYFGSAAKNGSVFPIPYAAGSAAGPSDTQSRETIANVHFRFFHGDRGSDDIQVLANVGRQLVHVYDSVNDLGGLNSTFWQWANAGAAPAYPTAEVYNGPAFSKYDPALAATYAYPSTSSGTTVIPSGLRGDEDSNNALFKVQYQHNFGSNAYARIYGYSNYSSWFVYDPIGAYYLPLPESGILGLLDDEVSSHTRGVALQFADQINAHHQLQGSASYTFSNDLRWYNSTSYDPGFTIQLRDGTGACYDTATGAAANCYSGNSFNSATIATGKSIGSASAVPTNLVLPTGAPAGAQYEVVKSGYSVVIGQPTTRTTTASLDDTWQNGKWTVDLGARYNLYGYGLGNTAVQGVVGGSNALYFAQYNLEHCYNSTTQELTTVSPGAACAAGSAHTNLSNDTASTLAHAVFEPRLSATYVASPNTVLRASAGTYSQPTRAAYIQYDPTTDLASYIASHFLQYGFTTPSHDIAPQISHNYDLSFEQRLPRSDATVKFTPYYRLTNNQTQAFVLDPTSSFQSGLNVGTLRAFGYEALLRLGDFDRDGLSGQLAFTYTNSKIRYTNFSGTTRNVIDQLNSQIGAAHFNSLTAKGGGSPCYSVGGGGVALAGTACPAGAVANPYYDSALQPVAPLDRNGWYSPYNLIPTPNGADIAFGYNSISYDTPEVLTALVQWKHRGWRIVPSLQYDLGFRYSSPFAWAGYDPSSCTSTTTTDCATLFRPNPYTGSYDGLGTFKSPTTLSLGLQVTRTLSKNVSVGAVFTNIVQQCYSHGNAWETGGRHTCSYALNPPQASGGPFLGNASNAAVNNALVNDPYGYAPYNGAFPFSAFLNVQVKL